MIPKSVQRFSEKIMLKQDPPRPLWLGMLLQPAAGNCSTDRRNLQALAVDRQRADCACHCRVAEAPQKIGEETTA
jgi:hypothetical protein